MAHVDEALVTGDEPTLDERMLEEENDAHVKPNSILRSKYLVRYIFCISYAMQGHTKNRRVLIV